MGITQPRAFGGFTGRRYGSFADKATDAHPVGLLTQPRAFGAHAGQRYGSFAGKVGGGAHPVDRLTQPRAFGAFTGRRYGSFDGRTAVTPEPSPGGGGRIDFRPDIARALRLRLIEEDDVLLLLIASQFAKRVQ